MSPQLASLISAAGTSEPQICRWTDKTSQTMSAIQTDLLPKHTYIALTANRSELLVSMVGDLLLSRLATAVFVDWNGGEPPDLDIDALTLLLLLPPLTAPPLLGEALLPSCGSVSCSLSE